MVKRLHDLGLSGWWWWATIPGVFAVGVVSAFSDDASLALALVVIWTCMMLLLGIYLGFFRGTRAANKYGSDPLRGVG